MKTQSRIIRLIAIGSHHGDDMAGWAVADILEAGQCEAYDVRKVSVPVDLLNRLNNVNELHIVDACHGHAGPGRLHRWDWKSLRKNKDSTFHTTGSHDMDVLSVLRLAECLGQLPAKVVVWGIQGEHFGPFDPLSTDITDQLPVITDTIAQELTHARDVIGAVADDAG